MKKCIIIILSTHFKTVSKIKKKLKMKYTISPSRTTIKSHLNNYNMKLIPIFTHFSTRLTGLCVLVLSLTLFWTSNAHGQSNETIQTDGNTYSFGYDKDAKYRDFVIPSTHDPATQFNQITFFLRGGDGGRRRVAGICTEPGGNGAKVTASFAIGTDEGELAPGGTIRLIVGQEGDGLKSNGLAGVGGGGGTAVLYKSPAYTGGDDCLVDIFGGDRSKEEAGKNWNDKCWIMLAVAGGGGGAYAAGGCATSSSGKPGNAGTDGTAGKGPNGWAGGSNGDQGTSNDLGGAGGGYKIKRPTNVNGGAGGVKGGSSPSNDLVTTRGGYGFGAGGPGLRGIGLFVWGGGGGGFSGGGAGDQYQGGGGGGSFANAKAVAFTKKDGNGTDHTPNNGVITYRFELNDDLVDAPAALCKDVVISISGDEVRLVPGDANDGSYDPNNRALSYLICAPDDFCSPAWIFDCNDIGKAYSYALKVDNGSQVTYCDFEVEIEQGSTSTFTCPNSVTVQLSDCIPILETNRNYGDVFVDFEPQNYPACNTVLAYYIVQPDNTIDNGSTDACGGIDDLALDITRFDCTDLGNNVVMLTATDNSGNTNTCTATVTVVDGAAPTASCQDLSINLNASGNATITANDIDNNSSDLCGINNLSLDISSFSCDDVGDNTVTLTATDLAGNTNTCTAKVTVADVSPPTAICKDFTIELDDTGSATLQPEDINDGSVDACGIANLALDLASFSCTDIGAHTVTLTATDNNGNTHTCTAIATVVDAVAPTALCQDKTVVLDELGKVTLVLSELAPSSTDNCEIDYFGTTITQCNPLCFDVSVKDQIELGCSDLGQNNLTIKVFDTSGNSSSCTSLVTVIDPIAPTASCKDLTISLDESGSATITTEDIDNASADACGIANLALDRTSFACEDVGEHIITLTVTDNNENINSCAATVTVIDAVAPTAICQDLTISLNESGLATITAANIDNGSADACGIANLALDNISFGCSAIGNNTVTLTATDNNGNTNTCNVTISVIDPVVPTALCQDLTIQLNDSGNASITASDVDAGSSDACGIADLAIDITDFDCSDLGTNSVNLSITDNNGNGNNCTAIITVEDLVAPEVVCQDITVTFNGEEAITVLPEDLFLADASFDACGLVSFVSQSQSAISCDAVGETLAIQIVAQDPNGNTNSCTALVEVIGMPCGVTEVGIGCASGADTAYDPDQAQFTITSDGCFEYPGESIAFAGTELCGDGEVVIHLADVEGNGYAGIVMRESLAPGARMVGVASNLTRNIRSEYRAITNGNLFRSIKRRTGAEWFRIIRIGQEFKSYSSNNGISWKVIRTVNLPNMPACLQVGMQAYSISQSEIFTATIDEFIINGSGVTSTYTGTAIPSTTTRVAPNIQLNPQDGGIQFQVAPNPFQGQTSIRFALSQRDKVQLQVFNLLGQQVKSWQEQTLEAGEYHFNWEAKTSNGQTLDAGIYLVRLRIGENWYTQKVSLLR